MPIGYITSNNMKQNQLYRLAIVGVLWLSIGAGCQKDPPEVQAKSCNDGTCCMQDTRQYDYVETIEAQPADLLYGNLIFKNGFPTNAERESFKSISLGICDLSRAKTQNLPNTVPIDSIGMRLPYPYRYRVWGKVYSDKFVQTFGSSPFLMIYVEKIEKVN